MERFKVPDKDPALSMTTTSFEIVLVDEGSPLSMVSPPLDDISEMMELERSCFSLKDHLSVKPVFVDALRSEVEELSSKSLRFDSSPTFHSRLANIQSALGDFESSRAAVEKALAVDDSILSNRKLGEIELALGHQAASFDVFRKLADFGDPYSALRVASFFVLQNDLRSASDWVARAVDLKPDGYAGRLFQGALHLIEGQYEAAVGFLRMALDEKPTSAHAYANLGFAYLGIGRPDKAFESLRRAVGLDPFNLSALVALADVGVVLKRDADIIGPLKFFVEFEQRESSAWGRLARALLNLGKIDDCIHALKRQGALSQSPSVWNNLGVAYAAKRQTQASIKSFKYALSLQEDDASRGAYLIARNVVQLLSVTDQNHMVVRIAGDLTANASQIIRSDEQLGDIFAFQISSLRKIGRKQEAIELCESLLAQNDVAGNLVVWIVTNLVAHYGLEDVKEQRIDELFQRYCSLREDSSGSRAALRALNNFAFAFAELGRLEDARNIIGLVSDQVHRDAYITATLGLVHFRSKKAASAERLYREAIQLAPYKEDRSRIRQKFHLEMGRAIAEESPRKSKRYLKKAMSESLGEKAISEQAQRLLRSLDAT